MSKQLITAVNAVVKIKRYYKELTQVTYLDAFFQGIITDAEYQAITAENNNGYIQAITA